MKVSKEKLKRILLEEFDKVFEAEKNYNTTQWKDDEGNYYSIVKNEESKWNVIKHREGSIEDVEVLKDQDGAPITFPDDGSAAIFLDSKGNRENKINTF